MNPYWRDDSKTHVGLMGRPLHDFNANLTADTLSYAPTYYVGITFFSIENLNAILVAHATSGSVEVVDDPRAEFKKLRRDCIAFESIKIALPSLSKTAENSLSFGRL